MERKYNKILWDFRNSKRHKKLKEQLYNNASLKAKRFITRIRRLEKEYQIVSDNLPEKKA